MDKILAIESSCDESSISFIENEIIKETITYSQAAEFRTTGGVIPELSARMHEINLPLVLQTIIEKTNLKLEKLDAIAVTISPGLIGCLQMGLQMAKTLAWSLKIPLITINHIAGHIYSGLIDHEYKYPLLSLIVSGGNTQLIYLKKPFTFDIIGETRDDAIGECFDKVARVLCLPYPGGPEIDQLAKQGMHQYKLPLTLLKDYDFSYSGLKSAVLNLVNSLKMKKSKINKANLAYDFQHIAIKQLIEQVNNAIIKYPTKQLIIGGGVAANSWLRNEVKKLPLEIILPQKKYCVDNAAMIAQVATFKFKRKLFSPLSIDVKPSGKVHL